MNRFIRQRLRNFKPWQLIFIAILVWGYVITRWVHGTEFLAGFWGIKDDEIAVVTIDLQDESIEDGLIKEITITDPGISLWDSLSVLGIPIVLFILGAWLQQSQQRQATDEAREEVLQVYFDRISTLLVDKNLMAIAVKETPNTSVILTDKHHVGIGATNRRTSEQQELLEVSLDVIRARSLSILRQFTDDIARKSSVVRFLAEAEIISKLKLDLNRADLQGADLRGAKLQGADFRGANLQEADFRGANLQEASLQVAELQRARLFFTKLQRAKLQGAYLQEANLYGASLQEANLQNASLRRVILQGADLQGANLEDVNLQGANLQGANLEDVDLQCANLEDVNLQGANLRGADLRGAILRRADLQWVYLLGARLQRADLHKIKYTDKFDPFSHFDNAITTWPIGTEVAMAYNVSPELQEHLGLSLSEPQDE